MVLLNDKKYACATCIKGHRSSSCNHTTRPLFAIRSKGRPVSQCDHCRELRKTKQVHVKCECEATSSAVAAGDHSSESGIQEATGASLIVTRKGARKVKTLEPALAAFPNGIQDVIEGAELLSSISQPAVAATSICACKDTGKCNCCTPRYIPKKASDDRSKSLPSKKPSISLTIPTGALNDNSPNHGYPRASPAHSPSIVVTPTSCSPGTLSSPAAQTHQHHASDGHQIGGTQHDHHSSHSAHYSPYFPSLSHHHYSHGRSGSNSPRSPNSPANPSPGGSMASPSSTAPHSASLLAPPMDFPYALQTSLLNVTASADDRPRSANSAHTGTGPGTPLEYSPRVEPLAEWMMVQGVSAGLYSPSRGGLNDHMGRASPGSSPTGDGTLLHMLNLGSTEQSRHQTEPTFPEQESPGLPLDFSTSKLSLSPMSPCASQSTNGQIREASSRSNLEGSSTDHTTLERQLRIMTAQGAVVPDLNLGLASPTPTFESDFDEDERVIQRASAALLKLGHCNHNSEGIPQPSCGNNSGVEIRFMSASPVPPVKSTATAWNNPFGISVGTRPCAQGLACHCWAFSGQPAPSGERCTDIRCQCCNAFSGHYQDTGHDPKSPCLDSSVVDLDIPSGDVGHAQPALPETSTVPTERYPCGLSPHTVPPLSRSRSSSSSSRISMTSASSHMPDGPTATDISYPWRPLSRASSTGALSKQAHKYKTIKPKPSNTSPDLRGANLAMQSLVPAIAMPSVLLPYKQNGDSSLPPHLIHPVHSTIPVSSGSNLGLSVQTRDLMNPAFREQIELIGSFPQDSPALHNAFSAVPANSSSPHILPSPFPSSASAASSPSHSRNFSHSSVQSVSSFGSSSTSSYPQTVSQISQPFSHSRSRSCADSVAFSTSFLQQPRPVTHVHTRASSASFLGSLRPAGSSPIEVIVSPPSPFGPSLNGNS